MDKCKKCVWNDMEDTKIFCDHIRDKGIDCNRFMSSAGIIKKNEDGTFDCPRCNRNRDPGKCWNCELEDE